MLGHITSWGTSKVSEGKDEAPESDGQQASYVAPG